MNYIQMYEFHKLPFEFSIDKKPDGLSTVSTFLELVGGGVSLYGKVIIAFVNLLKNWFTSVDLRSVSEAMQ